MRAVRVLIVEDDRAVRDAVRRALILDGHDCAPAADGEAALAAVAQAPPDAIVLDVGLPGLDGLEVCRRLRAAGERVPILMLTARDAVADRIDGLDAGADDYLVKPFDVGELQARVRALLRRSAPATQEEPAAPAFAELRLDPERHGVEVAGRLVELTRTEYALLEVLMRNPRQVLPHGVIYERVWGYDLGATSNALRVYVGYLRRKLDDAGARPLIHTLRGVGYALREPG